MNDVIDHAKSAAQELLGEADQVATKHLATLDEIQRKALAKVQDIIDGGIADSEAAALRVLEQARSEALLVQSKIFDDIDASLQKARCHARNIIVGDTQVMLGNLGRMIGTHRFRITLPEDEPWIGSNEADFEVEEPFYNTYIKVEAAMIESLSNMDDHSPFYRIIGTYKYLSELAKRAACLDGFDDSNFHPLNKKMIHYGVLYDRWNRAVNVGVSK